MAASWLLNALKSTSHSKIARTIRPGKIYPTRRPEPEPDPNFRVWVCQIRVRVKNGSTRMTRIRIRVGYGWIKFGLTRTRPDPTRLPGLRTIIQLQFKLRSNT